METARPMDPGTSDQSAGKDPVVRLHQAVIAGDENLVRGLLTQHKGLTDASDAGGSTALQLAVEHSQLPLVQILLDHGADLEAADASGRTPLHQAVERNNVPLATLLLRCGANAEAVTPGGMKPLWVAASKGSESVAKLLLQCKADVESFNTKSGTTALFEAVNQGHIALIKLLLDNGADINGRQLTPSVQAGRGPGIPASMHMPGGVTIRRAPAGGSPLVYCRKEKRADQVVYRRREKRADQAVYRRKEKRADQVVYRRKEKGATGLLDWMAGRRRAPDSMEDEESSNSTADDSNEEGKEHIGSVSPPPVLYPGPRPTSLTPHAAHAPPGWSNRPAYDVLSTHFNPGHSAPPSWLGPGTLGPQAGQPKPDREIPLHKAVLNGDIEIIRLLLQHGADISIRGKDGRSAQQVAEERDVGELAALLLSGFLLEGPAIKKEKSKQREPQLGILPAPRRNSEKMACRIFEATMVEFYIGDREQRHQASAPVFNVLYGEGPESILASGRPKSVAERRPSFTWYHLPANNVRSGLETIRTGNGLTTVL
jgi:ankyrin repeat protein